MGGFGSGGWNLRHAGTVEGRRRIDACAFAREGLLKQGIIATVSWGEGDGKNSIVVLGGPDEVRLQYSWRRGDAPWMPHEETISIDRLARPYGGAQAYFRCPKCSRRVRFLIHGEIRYLCRHCLDLVHASTRERESDRAMRKVNKLRRRIGAEIGLEAAIGPKPKGMHQATFDRIYTEILQGEEIVWAEGMRIVRRLGGKDDFGWLS